MNYTISFRRVITLSFCSLLFIVLIVGFGCADTSQNHASRVRHYGARTSQPEGSLAPAERASGTSPQTTYYIGSEKKPPYNAATIEWHQNPDTASVYYSMYGGSDFSFKVPEGWHVQLMTDNYHPNDPYFRFDEQPLSSEVLSESSPFGIYLRKRETDDGNTIEERLVIGNIAHWPHTLVYFPNKVCARFDDPPSYEGGAVNFSCFMGTYFVDFWFDLDKTTIFEVVVDSFQEVKP